VTAPSRGAGGWGGGRGHPAAPGTRDGQARPGASAFRPSLRRSPFGIADELSCYYDAPAEPCNVHVEVRVPGNLDARALRDATAAALAAQPRALVRRAAGAWWRQYAWEVPGQPDCDPVTTAAWADEDELAQVRARFLSAAPPLHSSPPLRILLAAGPGEDRVILNAHHAALDGLSSLELLRSIAEHYPGAGTADPAEGAGAGGARRGASGAKRGASGAKRGAGGGPAAEDASAREVPAAQPAGVGRGAAEKARQGRAARIAADREPGRATGLPGYGFVLLPARPVPAGRHPGGGTVNDVLIAGLVVAIARWNSAHGRPAGLIRITMPVNARPQGQAGAAGNLSRLTTVSVPAPSDGCDLAGLVADVAAQTRPAKRQAGPQVDPASRALAAAWWPPPVKRGLLRLGLRTAGRLLCDTSLVSNLGVVGPPRFGAATATDMWFSTSAHMPRGLSVGAVTVGGRLHLCLRYRCALFSKLSAARFAGLYATALGNLTSQGGTGDR
jgi:NRPS condensation-like uncharacterized protein